MEKTDKRFLRPLEVSYLRGNNKKAKNKLGWKPKTTFENLVKIMLDEDLKRWKMCLDGKTVVWDAPLYPSESKFITRLSNENTNMKLRRSHLKKKK